MVNRRDAMKAAAVVVLGAALPAAPVAATSIGLSANTYIGVRNFNFTYDPSITDEELTAALDKIEWHPPLES